MTKKAFPLPNSPILSLDEWSEIAGNWLGTGVIKSFLNELQVYADSSGMQVKIRTGSANIKGVYFKSDAIETLSINTADGTNPRIDRVIVRLDIVAETADFAILQGVPSTTPVAPALTQNSSRWEISLALVTVAANVVTIASGNVTDDRQLIKIANSVPEKWIGIVLQNGWITLDSQYEYPSYRKNDFGMVEIRGFLKPSSTIADGTVIFTLPAGYRPERTHVVIVTTNDGTQDLPARVHIEPGGAVKAYKAKSAHFQVGNISFPAYQ